MEVKLSKKEINSIVKKIIEEVRQDIQKNTNELIESQVRKIIFSKNFIDEISESIGLI